MSEYRCKNCNGTLMLMPEKRIAVCEYCGSEFNIAPHNSSSVNNSAQSNTNTALDLFYESDFYDLENKYRKDAVITMQKWLSAFHTSDECLQSLSNIGNAYKEWATPNLNSALFENMRMRFSPLLSPDEKPLFYKDSGIISLGKTGLFITSKQIFYFKKNEKYKISISDIRSIHFDITECFFNKNNVIKIDNIVCTGPQCGAIMALISLLVHETQPDNFKLKLLIK